MRLSVGVILAGFGVLAIAAAVWMWWTWVRMRAAVTLANLKALNQWAVGEMRARRGSGAALQSVVEYMLTVADREWAEAVGIDDPRVLGAMDFAAREGVPPLLRFQASLSPDYADFILSEAKRHGR